MTTLSIQNPATGERITEIPADDAVSDAIALEPTGGTIKISEILISEVGEDAETRRQVVQAANGWYTTFTHDVFG